MRGTWARGLSLSISPTVGALAKLLSKARFDQHYRKAKERGGRIVKKLPKGELLWRLGRELEHRIKGFFTPSPIWQELGLSYIGPIDGHNIHDIETVLSQARDKANRPTLIHVVTTKGKGHSPAESNAVYFHGVPAKGGGNGEIPTYSEIFAQTILKLAKDEPKLVVITPAMPEGNCLNIVEAEYPERVFDVGICEQHAVTFAAGMATRGLIPVVAIYSTFLQRAFDQIIHDVCLQKLPVIFAVDRGGIVGDDGKTHQGTFDISYLTMIPELIVASPKDENELQHLLYTAVRASKPMAVRYPRNAGLGVKMDEKLHELPIGKGEVLRYGEDAAIIALGASVAPAAQAAEELARKGIEATVINARYAKPLDNELILDVARRIKRIVTVEENILIGGFGSSVLELLEEAGVCDLQVACIGVPDEFVEHGSQAILRSKFGLDTQGIVRRVLDMFPESNVEAEIVIENEAKAT
jgi:1-deoxy-D-xylulose-5-phosphate synthase